MYKCKICGEEFSCIISMNSHMYETTHYLFVETKDDEEIESKVRLPSLLEEFDAAIRTITDERGKVYGEPKEDFERAQGLIKFIEPCTHPGIRHVLTMLCVKMSRLVNSPNHLDSWTDIVGYARTAVMILDKEKEARKE